MNRNTRPLKPFAAVLLLVATTLGACGSDDEEETTSNPGEQCDPLAMQTPPGCESLAACYEANCAESYAGCLGPNYRDLDFTGAPCRNLAECSLGCECDTTCLQQCALSVGTEPACLSCQATVLGCLTTNCNAEYTACQQAQGT